QTPSRQAIRCAIRGAIAGSALLLALPLLSHDAKAQSSYSRAAGAFDQESAMSQLDALTSRRARSQDPADSLFRSAQAAMRRNDNARAASLFRTVRTKHTTSPLAADAGYWEAFSLQRAGGQSNLEMAL